MCVYVQYDLANGWRMDKLKFLKTQLLESSLKPINHKKEIFKKKIEPKRPKGITETAMGG